MMLKDPHDYRPKPRLVEIKDAVQYALNGNFYEPGQIEALASTSNKVLRFCGELLHALHKKGVLSDDEVVKLLHGSWEKAGA